jgi:hypothetical protein
MGKSKAVSSHRSPRKKDPESHAKARRVGDRVPQLPKTFCGHEGVLECSGLTELWMGSSASMGKSKAVSSHRSPRKKDPESHAKARKVGDRVPQLPKKFCENEGVLECSGLTELEMGSSAPMGKIQSGVKPPQSKKEGSGRNFWKMITFAPSRLRMRRFPLPHCSRFGGWGEGGPPFFRSPPIPLPPRSKRSSHLSTAADRIKCLCAGFTAPHPEKKRPPQECGGLLKNLD